MVAPLAEDQALVDAGGRAFDTIVSGTDEGPDRLEANIERRDAFLQANNFPEDVQARCWSGTMARILDIPAEQ